MTACLLQRRHHAISRTRHDFVTETERKCGGQTSRDNRHSEDRARRRDGHLASLRLQFHNPPSADSCALPASSKWPSMARKHTAAEYDSDTCTITQYREVRMVAYRNRAETKQ